MTKNTVPTQEECLKIFERYAILSNIVQHCVSVTTLAVYIGKRFKKSKNPDLDLDVVFSTSLFHDLAKISQLKTLDPEKYHFDPLTPEQTERWQILLGVSQQIQRLFDDVNTLFPGLDKKVHETDVTAIIVGSLYPGFIPYLHSIGGTRNEVYFGAGDEIKIMHYADWRMSAHRLDTFESRIEYNLNTYWPELPQDKRDVRKQKEFALEKGIFDGLDITPDISVDELNAEKKELFGGKYDYFEIEAV